MTIITKEIRKIEKCTWFWKKKINLWTECKKKNTHFHYCLNLRFTTMWIISISSTCVTAQPPALLMWMVKEIQIVTFNWKKSIRNILVRIHLPISSRICVNSQSMKFFWFPYITEFMDIHQILKWIPLWKMVRIYILISFLKKGRE